MRLRMRPARAYQHPMTPVRVLADAAIPHIKVAMAKSLKTAGRLLDKQKAVTLMQAGRFRDVADIIDWNHANEAMRRTLGMLGEVWIEGGNIGARQINKQFAARGRSPRYRVRKDISASSDPVGDGFAFDRFSPNTQEQIRAYQDALIAQLGEDSRSVIEQAVLDGARAGKTPDQIVSDIRAVIGLTDTQAQAVINFRDQLAAGDGTVLTRALLDSADAQQIADAIAAGEPLAEDIINQMTQNYEANYIDYRAGVIAQTEATRAASLGLQDAYQQAIDSGVMPGEAVTQRWQISLDERTCEHCISVYDQNPDGVGMGESFDSDLGPVDAPPLHVNCRCSLEMVTNLDMVPVAKFDCR